MPVPLYKNNKRNISMFYVKLGLLLYSHTKVYLLNIGTNSIVASEQYFSTQESFTNNSFILTESRNADKDFLSQLEHFAYKGLSEKGNMFSMLQGFL